ncbi:pSer/pThr/pTyr-binding forkhead associated (FHA) protein [Arthrobacter pigmenti]|uniref:PSer/pThr/pTyr-binding forkhead associated (FHA) protein n=1 Tax=Arthrobacter pigmenti TaxID=271432 RepID=A0A846RSK7_9MICC|nr:FHA domain-containing protein [Arthrobacter pigmenti]NJC22056.1 pSer/pThr/pTyr-binding forkhead associated (FHA) protein [Arthrobacter pigmenti]
MVGENNAAAKDASGSHVPSPETTTIGLPPQTASTAVEPRLTGEELAAVAALPAGSALLIAHTGPNAGARFLLDEDVTTAGRHPNADIFLDDVTVSRKHAEFRRGPEGFRVEDARSLNGTYVNNDRVDNVVLRNGHEVQIGKFRLTFYAAGSFSQPQGQA